MKFVLEGWDKDSEDKEVVVSIDMEEPLEYRAIHFDELDWGFLLSEFQQLIRYAERT